MKLFKRITASILAFVMVLLMVPNFSTEVQAQTLTLVELQAKYPDGKYWNHYVNTVSEAGDLLDDYGNESFGDSVTSTPCALHGVASAEYFVGKYDCNYFDKAWQCRGFARRMGYEAFGSKPTTWSTHSSIASIKPGDVVEFISPVTDQKEGHGVFVIAVSGSVITVGEANLIGDPCCIKWGSTYDLSTAYAGTLCVRSAPWTLDTSSSGGSSQPSINYTAIAAGDYYLMNTSTSKYLAVDAGVDAAWQNVSVASFTGGNEMKMAISAASSGYIIRPHCASRIINPDGDSVISGLNVNIVNDLSDSSQWWGFEKVDGGYVIRNMQNQNCVLDVSGTNVIVSTYTGAASQIWKLKSLLQYTVTYDACGGINAPAAQTLFDGETITLSTQVPTRVGYVFQGWTHYEGTSAMYQPGDAYAGTGDTTLYAVWKEENYTINYSANGGSGIPDYQTKPYGGSVVIPSKIPTRTGYTFLGWSTDSSATTAQYQPGDTYTADGNVTLYAVWQINTYAVSYDANGGNGAPAAQTKTYGQNLTLSGTVPTRDGYTFLGWATDSAATAAGYQPGGTYTSDSGVTLYAVWQKSTFAVTYDANGGTGAPEAQEKTSGQQLTLATGAPTRTGYIFLGWATDSTATTAQYQPGDPYTEEAAITLYALWEEDHWSFDPETGTLTVFMEGPMDDYTSGKAPWYIYADQIQTVCVADSVTEIGNYAFYGLSNLISVQLHENITRIGSVAFGCCTTLTTIDLPGSLTALGNSAFTGCESLETIVIPSGITELTGTFDGCKSLKKVVLPDSMTTIGTMAFYACSSLEEVTWPASLKTIGYEAFRMCNKLAAVELPDGLEEIGYHAFSGCGFTEIFIPASVKTIYREFDPVTLETIRVDENNPVYWADERGVLFEGTKLHTAPFRLSGNYQILDGTTKICHSAFKNNPNITSVIMPVSVTEIEGCAFENCNSLTTVYYVGTSEQYAAITVSDSNVPFVNANVVYIAMEGTCGENLTWKLNGGVLTVSGTDAMTDYGDVGLAPWNELEPFIETVEITDGVTTIGSYAFYGLENVKTVAISNDVTEIGASAFYENTALTELVLGNSVATIGKNAFAECTALNTVTLSDSLTELGESAFANCQVEKLIVTEGTEKITATMVHVTEGYLKEIEIPNGVKTIGDSAFDGCDGLESVTLPDSVEMIGSYAFANTDLAQIHIPINVSVIGDWAFYTCTALQSVIIPDSVITIEYGTFENCTKLTSVDFGDGVTTIESYAFYMCPLTEIVLPEGLEEIGTQAFDGAAVQSVTLPSTLEKIGQGAFWSCNGLRDVYYAGTSAQWEDVQVGVDNDYLLSATLYTAEALLEHITIKTQPTKTVYEIGESLDVTGLTLTAAYSDGSTETVTTGYTVSGFDSATAGAKTVTVTYEGCTTTFTVTVNEQQVDESMPKYEILGATGTAGSEVEVYVAIANNPGIISLRNAVSYDTTALELVKVENMGLLSGYTTPSATIASPYTLRWADSLATANNTANGNIVKLTFLIKEGTETGDYMISVNPVEARNFDGTKINFDGASANITVIDYIPGDSDGDGEVSDWDAIMLNRYLAGWGAEIGLGADADGDGEISDWDAIILERYLAGWNVELGK